MSALEKLKLTTGEFRLLCDEHANARAGQLEGFARYGREGETCDDCQEIANRPERRLLLEALTAVDEFIDNLDDSPNPFLSTGCNGCTEGCTPNRFNTGPCWRHAAKLLLAGKVKTDQDRKIEMKAAVIAAVMELADEEAGTRVAFIDAAALSAKIGVRLDALVDARLI